jgi:hypothetical protein
MERIARDEKRLAEAKERIAAGLQARANQIADHLAALCVDAHKAGHSTLEHAAAAAGKALLE